MNILDMMNKITELSKPIVEAKEEKTTHKGGTATTDEKGTKHKGKYGTDFQGDEDDDKTDDYGKKKKAKPAVAAPAAEKRGRGRPPKGSDKDGNVMKPDFSAFGAKKDVKLPKWDKKKTTKHSLKDWIEHYDKALNEDGQLTATPLPGATAIKNAQGQQVATAATPQAAAMMTKGDITMTDPTKKLQEVERNHMGETEYHGYYKWRVACRNAGAVEFVGDRDIDEGHNAQGKAVGEWDGVVGSVYGDAHKQRPAAPAGPALAEAKKKAKPDFLDKDKDGNKKEPFKKAVKDAKQVKEGRRGREPSNSISAPTETGSKAVYKGTPEYAQEKKRKADQEKQQKNTIHNDKMAMRDAKQVKEGKVKELSMDLDDRTMKDAEFKKKYGKTKAEMQKSVKPEAKKPVSKIKESILRESHDTMKHIISKFKHEVKNFVAGEELDQDLYDALYDYYCDMGEMPYGTMKARDGDPFEWVMQKFNDDVQEHDVPVDESTNPMIDVPAITRKYQGSNGESRHPMTLDQVGRNNSLSHLPNVKTAAAKLATSSPWDSAPVANVQFEGWEKELDSLLSEGMNVTANTGLGDGPDSVTISATDEDAQHLLSIVKSAGLGMFAGDEQSDPEGSPQMSIQGQDNPEADIDVVDDHDDMLGLIRKMTGQGGGQPGTAEVEVDEGGCQACESGSCQEHGQQVTDETETPDQAEEMAAENTPTFGAPEADEEGSSEEEVQQATEKLEKVHDAWSQAGSDDGEEESSEGDEESDEVDEGEPKGGEDLSHEDTKDMSQDEVDHALDKDLEDEEEEEKEEVTEWANDAGGNLENETFESDIDFMQNVISGGMNGRKRTQSVGNPVTIASTPMKESTDLLKDWVKLSGL